jgi:Dyp-type peroxidase family
VTVATRLADETLADIQGFITSGYGHLPLARYVFLQIHEATRARQYLAQLLPRVTTAAPWPVVDGEKLKPSVAVNVALTAAGLAALGLPEQVRCTFAPEFLDGIATGDRSAILGDTEESGPERWEFGGSLDSAIHIVVIVHGASFTDLDGESAFHRGLVSATLGAVTELAGETQNGYRPAGGREPFGFRDGIAQPSIRGIPGDGVPTGEFILGYENHYGLVPPGPVVPAGLAGSALLPPLANPYHQSSGLRDLGLNGSYVVYRKLQQDVAGFWQFMQRETLRASGRAGVSQIIWVASRMMGRWPSGAPLAMTPEHDDPRLADRNDFLYDDDVDGFACPLGAHVRRTNPRAVLKPYPTAQSLSMSEAHRLLRRARVFGPPLFDAAGLRHSEAGASVVANLADDGVARGVHFFCVNASIKSQFEFVQQTWCNNPRFGGLTVNKDPIAGDNARSDAPASHMEIPRRPVSYRTAALPRFVTVKAGAYLFMPSITALRFLSGALGALGAHGAPGARSPA